MSKTKSLLLIHPVRTLGLVAIAVLLSICVAYLAGRLGLPDRPQPDDLSGLFQLGLLNLAVLFPLELYFIPRWLLATDAFTPEESRNSRETWRKLFEDRWGRFFLARILVLLASSIGFMFCIVPGFLILLYFGWTPWRVLLQGETIQTAAKGSVRTMAFLWPQVSMAVVVILLIVFASNDLASRVFSQLGRGPGWHASNVFAQFTIVWMNAAMLMVYQWMESAFAKITLNLT